MKSQVQKKSTGTAWRLSRVNSDQSAWCNFIQMFQSGKGDYITESEHILSSLSRRELDADIECQNDRGRTKQNQAPVGRAQPL